MTQGDDISRVRPGRVVLFEVRDLIVQRQLARNTHHWEEADRLRDVVVIQHQHSVTCRVFQQVVNQGIHHGQPVLCRTTGLLEECQGVITTGGIGGAEGVNDVSEEDQRIGI